MTRSNEAQQRLLVLTSLHNIYLFDGETLNRKHGISRMSAIIKSTVSESLSARQTAPAPVYSAVPASPVASSASSSLDSTFGVGGTNNIQVETPVYQFDAEF